MKKSSYLVFSPFSFSLFVILFTLFGCNPQMMEDCATRTAPAIRSNSPVVSGNNLELSIDPVLNAQGYYWTGPNGFTSQEQSPVIYNVQAGSAGRYKVEVRVAGGCDVAAISDSVIVTIPAAPCSPANNTVTIEGATDITFTNITGQVSGGSHFFTANGSGGDLEIEFPGTERPAPGVYTIRSLGDQWLRGDVRVRMVALSSNWPAAPGKLYVTQNASNKLTFTYCNVPVVSQTFGFHSTATGRVSER